MAQDIQRETQTGGAAARSRSLAPLTRLLPYIGRYRGLVLGAGVSLVLAACTTLALPLAVRRMIDRVAGLLEAAHDERGDLGIIFHDEDAHGWDYLGR